MFGYQNCFTNAFQNIQNSLNAVSNRLSTLSSSIISSNNLPIYLQNYTFSSGGVLTPYFTIVGGLSTNQSLHRTWNLVTAGSLSSGSNPTDPLIFTYDFSGVVSSYSVTIDQTLAGTLVLGGQVYDAALYFETPAPVVNNILTLTLNVPTDATTGDFYYNLYLADGSCSSQNNTYKATYYVKNGLFFSNSNDSTNNNNEIQYGNGNLIFRLTLDGGIYNTVNITVYFLDNTKCGCAKYNDKYDGCKNDSFFTTKWDNLQIEVINTNCASMNITVTSYTNCSSKDNFCTEQDTDIPCPQPNPSPNYTATATIGNTYKYFTCYCSNSNQYFTAD